MVRVGTLVRNVSRGLRNLAQLRQPVAGDKAEAKLVAAMQRRSADKDVVDACKSILANNKATAAAAGH